MIIDAEAEAERLRRLAKGEADAIFAKMDAEARGIYELLTKQAQGYDRIVQAAGWQPRQGSHAAHHRKATRIGTHTGRSREEHQDRQGNRMGWKHRTRGKYLDGQLHIGYDGNRFLR